MATKTFKMYIQHARDTAENWQKNNPILLSGEIAFETDTNLFKFGDGVKKYNDLPYAGTNAADIQSLIDASEDNTYVVEATAEQTTDDAALATISNPSKGDIAIVKRTISGDKVSHTAYVYDTEWRACDGNYNANNVYFDADFVYTAAIGTKTVPSTGSGTIAAAGKNIKQVLADILAKEKNPTTTQPTATLNSNNIGSKEVGTKISINYSFSTNAGSYTYGPATGVTFSGFTATFNNETKEGSSGTFSEVQVTDTTNLSISGTCSSSEGAIPKTNIGNNYDAGKIAAKDYTPTKGTLTGFRGWFWGYKNGTNAITAASITSDQVRALGNGPLTSIPAQISTNQMKQIFFAIPKGKKTSISVADATNGAPQTVTKITDVMVKGANGYDAVAYDVWYVDNAAAATGSAKFNVTVK